MKGRATFKNLFTPGKIGNLELKNRIVKAPMWTGYSTRDGEVTDRLVNHYRENAKGGAGLIIVEYSYVDTIASRAGPGQLGNYDADCMPGLSTLADTIKNHGAKACLQLMHCGPTKYVPIPPIKAPSQITMNTWMGDITTKELTVEEINGIIGAFAYAAWRAQSTGFDMVEIHGGQGYLINAFLSPTTNKRTDEYGGSLENRMKFLMAVYGAIRGAVGNDYPIGVRLNANEYLEGGTTIEDAIVFTKILEGAGVNVIHLSAGVPSVNHKAVVPMYYPLGYNLYLAEALKKVVSKVPVIASGSITTPALAEEVIASGKGDFVSLARPMLADPYFPNKALEGKEDEIRPCIRCNECSDKAKMKGILFCAVNFLAGNEQDYQPTPVENPKNVAIVGGGPAGMEAARIATLRGHKVTLYAKEGLGGRLVEAGAPEFKSDIKELIKYFTVQLEKLNIKVIKEEATAEKLLQGNFDAIIIATGGKLNMHSIPGIDKPIATDILKVLKGEKVGDQVIVAGAGVIGCEVAIYLAKQGKKVVMTTRRKKFQELASDATFSELPFIMENLKRLGVDLRLGLQIKEVTDKGVIAVDEKEEKHEISAESVVFSPGFIPDRSLAIELEKQGLEICTAGDCVAPRKVVDAVREGFLAGFNL